VRFQATPKARSQRGALLGRRAFTRGAIGGVLATGALSFARKGAATKLEPLSPGIKICAQLPLGFTGDDLTFVKQAGVEWVTTWANYVDGPPLTAETFARIKQRVEHMGLKLWNVGNARVHNMEEVTLGLPGRDQKIEEYKENLRNLARAGLTYTTYAHMGNGVWSTNREPTRGGASARAFDLSKAEEGEWAGKVFNAPLTHGRLYTNEEIWDNFKYFIKAVAPVAEEVGIRIGLHPDDPPVPVLGGVPRCIFGNFDGFVRALEIANSPNVGVCLCCGTWLEGGKLMGKTVLQAIEYFGKRGKLWKVHYRNVTAPLPHFVETFVDSGYMDMYQIMHALKKVDFRGAVIPDHVPEMVGGKRVGAAYTLAYMKAHLERANAATSGVSCTGARR
jgi:mannonate dehydratase